MDAPQLGCQELVLTPLLTQHGACLPRPPGAGTRRHARQPDDPQAHERLGFEWLRPGFPPQVRHPGRGPGISQLFLGGGSLLPPAVTCLDPAPLALAPGEPGLGSPGHPAYSSGECRLRQEIWRRALALPLCSPRPLGGSAPRSTPLGPLPPACRSEEGAHRLRRGAVLSRED